MHYVLPLREPTDERLQLLLFHGRYLLQGEESYLWRPDQLPALGKEVPLLPLQAPGSARYAAVPVGEALARELGARPVGTRELLLQEGFDRFSLVGQGSQMVHWYSTHRFCGRCGQPTALRGPRRVLGCEPCGVDYYPRISPCIIVLVTRGREVLLARHARHPSGFYSCLAGFIEAGETPEQAVHREVAEEAGITIRDVRYVASQPWPFPSQLMLGYFAEHAGGDIRLVDRELESAQWFDIDKLPPVPSADISVAGRLIQRYRNEKGGRKKRDREKGEEKWEEKGEEEKGDSPSF
ncbi:MAG: NAD(+) diphosphatase [Pseudohongiellaceae bacterium]